MKKLIIFAAGTAVGAVATALFYENVISKFVEDTIKEYKKDTEEIVRGVIKIALPFLPEEALTEIKTQMRFETLMIREGMYTED